MPNIVDAIESGRYCCDEQAISAVLTKPQELIHQSTFTGRPATRVYADEQFVAKLRVDFVFQPKDVVKKANIELEKERLLGCYHPRKTWFYTEINGEILLGNVTPRLQTLHTQLPTILKAGFSRAELLLKQLFALYFDLAKHQDKRLDEGLSNFGFDADDKLFYLDDDIYAWDNFTSFASVLAVWIRQLEPIREEEARTLGRLIAEELTCSFNEPHALQVFYGQLRQNLAVSERESRCLDAIMQEIWQAAKRFRNTFIVASDGEHEVAENASSVHDRNRDQLSLSRITDERFAVIADVHANLPALESVLAELNNDGIEQILILGDVVGYGPFPNECVAMLKQYQCLTIQGNHDYAAATGDSQKGFSKLALWAIDWTREVLNRESVSWLNNLEPLHKQDNWMAVHGSPIDKQFFYAYVYQMTYQANLDFLVNAKIKIAFHGHSHIQNCFYRRKNTDSSSKEAEQALLENQATLVCPGSVGQPRGGATAAEYAIFNSATGMLQLKSVEYDLQRIIAQMKTLNFPATLYERLSQGK